MDIEISDLSDDSSNEEQLSNMFEISSNIPDDEDDTTLFDTDLPAEHNYLGNLERVSGVQYLEPNRNYWLPIILHNSLVFPGETLPMILAPFMFSSPELNEDGILFGLVSREIRNSNNLNLYGVTCQIYEKSNDARDHVSIKSRAYQRFYIKNNNNIPEFTIRHRTRFATVIILPEIVLSHPIYGFDSNSLSKFRRNEQMKCKLLKYQSKSLPWPEFVYRMYDVRIACEKIKKFLTTLKIETVPMDLVTMSFWFCQNAILSTECRRKAFLTDNVLERVLLICQSLQDDKYIVCKNCRTKLAKMDNVFAMSKEGIRTNFCNSAGYIHETHTIIDTLPEVVLVSGALTSEFSWFPGYSWRYVHCAQCNSHLGWKYFSRSLTPKSFIGLTGTSINFENLNNGETNSAPDTDSGPDDW